MQAAWCSQWATLTDLIKANDLKPDDAAYFAQYTLVNIRQKELFK